MQRSLDQNEKGLKPGTEKRYWSRRAAEVSAHALGEQGLVVYLESRLSSLGELEITVLR